MTREPLKILFENSRYSPSLISNPFTFLDVDLEDRRNRVAIVIITMDQYLKLLPIARNGGAIDSSASSKVHCQDSTAEISFCSSVTSVTDDSASAAHGLDPSVVVGFAFRFPGASNISQLWDVVTQKKDLRREIPEDRFNIDAYHHPMGSNKGTVSFQNTIGIISSLTNISRRTLDMDTSWTNP